MITSMLQLAFRAPKLTRYAGKPVTLAVTFAPTDGVDGTEGTVSGVPVNSKGVYQYTIFDVHYYTNGKPGQFRLGLVEGPDQFSDVLIDDEGNAVEDTVGIP